MIWLQSLGTALVLASFLSRCAWGKPRPWLDLVGAVLLTMAAVDAGMWGFVLLNFVWAMAAGVTILFPPTHLDNPVATARVRPHEDSPRSGQA